ncbi:MAG TPA: hypothetical protein VEF72_01025 [Mycobacterium sp.]|nr:hypothetical protein [Mycobacterium sp.]
MTLSRSGAGEGLRWYQIVYWLAYRVGLIIWQPATPWPISSH